MLYEAEKGKQTRNDIVLIRNDIVLVRGKIPCQRNVSNRILIVQTSFGCSEEECRRQRHEEDRNIKKNNETNNSDNEEFENVSMIQ